MDKCNEPSPHNEAAIGAAVKMFETHVAKTQNEISLITEEMHSSLSNQKLRENGELTWRVILHA